MEYIKLLAERFRDAIKCAKEKDKINPNKSDGGFAYIMNASKSGLIQL